jgi:hypothetical protein
MHIKTHFTRAALNVRNNAGFHKILHDYIIFFLKAIDVSGGFLCCDFF